ncbi:caspase family protein [Bradyrhizobium cenepequi]
MSMTSMKWRGSFTPAVAAIALGLASIAASPAEAETRAVVVGINDYINVPKLKGAVADAEDIAAALKKSGAKDVVLLRDAEATRKSVLEAIEQLIARARKDDLVIITLAGHGAREVWGNVHPPGTNKGDPHEVYLLRNVTLPNAEGRIDPKLGGSASDRIFGGEIAMRLKRLNDIGVRTIFVADACHGAGLTREPILGAPSRFESERVVPNIFAFAEGEDPLRSVIATLPAPIDTDKDLRSLTFLAAVDPFSKAPEVEIPKGSGKMRGALSYAFARAIEGDANHGGVGDLTHGDLLSYVKASVSNSMIDSGKSQKPDLRPRDNFGRVVVRFGSDLTASPTPVSSAPVADNVRIYTRNGKPVDALKRPQRGFGIQPVSSLAEADLIYDPSAGEVFSKGGDLIAMRLRAADLEGVAEREVAIRRLVELAKPRARALTLDHGDRRYFAGDRMSLDARKTEGQDAAPEYYTLIVISGDGKVQYQYPLGKDPKIFPNDRLLNQMEASEPFGADYAIFVSDVKPLDGLIKSLCQLDGERDPNLAVRLIERALTGTMQIGLQGIYTAPRPGPVQAASMQATRCAISR